MKSLNITKICEMLKCGATCIADNCEYINKLNVFPIPDGDTGTNMKITTEGGANAIAKNNFANLSDLAKAYSMALLMNARGNSGVIFSQIIKGFTLNFSDSTAELLLSDLLNSFTLAAKQAYKSVSEPVEGTMLTIIRLTAEKVNEKKEGFASIESLFEYVVKTSKEILAKTPEMLAILKEAKVVDSGGYALCCFFEGMRNALKQKNNNGGVSKDNSLSLNFDDSSFLDTNEGFGYCCEFLLSLGAKVTLKQKNKIPFSLTSLKKKLKAIGDSLVVVVDNNIVKVHVHSTSPNKVLEIGARYGEFIKVKIENMTLQFIEKNPNTTLAASYINESAKANLKTSKVLINTQKLIATVPTDAIEKFFIENLKVDHCINYGVDGAPSIQRFLNAFKSVKSSNIICIVDDKNFIFACQEAIKMVSKGIHVSLIKTSNISISYLVCLAHNPLLKFNVNVKNLNRIANNHYATISKSIKKIKFQSVKINENDYIGFFDNRIIVSDKNIKVVFSSLINRLSRNFSHKNKNKELIIMTNVAKEDENIKWLKNNTLKKYLSNLTTIDLGDSNSYIYHFTIG